MKLYLCCTDGYYIYGDFKLDSCEALRSRVTRYSCKCTHVTAIDSAFFHYLIKELFLSYVYRKHFIKKFIENYHISMILIQLLPTKYNLIDYNWNERVYQLVRERCELDHALSWLSTLGGAFSALGDYFINYAETAGKISVNQLKLAQRLGDPSIAARCRLYLSLSLIQKKKYIKAKWIIKKEYEDAKVATVIDARLINMCKGIWSKLQYEHSIYKKMRHLQ